jgi:hypothetical protein
MFRLPTAPRCPHDDEEDEHPSSSVTPTLTRRLLRRAALQWLPFPSRDPTPGVLRPPATPLPNGASLWWSISSMAQDQEDDMWVSPVIDC